MIEEAYLAEEGGKWLITKAVQYRPEAQNRLLKLIEEPPNGVNFIILTKSKSFLLPTIRSRLPVLFLNYTKSVSIWNQPKTSLELSAFLKEAEGWNKDVAKEKLTAFLSYVATLDCNKMELLKFDTAYTLLSLNSRPSIVFAWLLSMKVW
jgi:DNA polymerase-3 subunit delta'